MFYQSKGKWEENTIKDLFLSFNSYNLRARISVMILLFAPELIFVGAGNERAVNDGYNDYYCIFIMQYLYHIF